MAALSVTVHGITIKTGAQTSGRFATANITTSDGSDTIVHTVSTAPDMDYALLSLSLCNRDNVALTDISVAIAAADVPLDAEFIEWKVTLVPHGVLERTQLVANPGDRIIVRVGTP